MSELRNKRLFLLDMDGTIYLGDSLFDGTRDFLSLVKGIGGRYLFLTNNSSRGVDSYVGKLKKLGIDSVRLIFIHQLMLPSNIFPPVRPTGKYTP
jgi:ribonucleotide monophosphatase NagD (HAD superfamily)